MYFELYCSEYLHFTQASALVALPHLTIALRLTSVCVTSVCVLLDFPLPLLHSATPLAKFVRSMQQNSFCPFYVQFLHYHRLNTDRATW